MGALPSITLNNSAIRGINSAMDRKNINRGFKKLRVRQGAVSLGFNSVPNTNDGSDQ
jgi:hypothetical protein